MDLKAPLLMSILTYLHIYREWNGYLPLAFIVLYGVYFFVIRRRFIRRKKRVLKEAVVSRTEQSTKYRVPQNVKFEEGTKTESVEQSVQKGGNDDQRRRRVRSRRSKALVDPSTVLMRRNINSLSSSEFERFSACIEEMKSSGSFYEVASYHQRYCHHGSTSFPSWHAPYLLDFEKRLQAADEFLGGNGHITCPYWDWTEDASLPDRIEQLQPNGSRISRSLTSSDRENLSGGDKIRRRDPTAAIRRLQRDLPQMFRARNYIDFASLGGNSSNSLEQYHNDVHVACSYPMNTVSYAAFDVTFFLHHCNLDRIHRTYIQGDDSWDRTFRNQDSDDYERSLSPFVNDITGRTYRCSDFANVEDYPRTYDVRYDPPNTSRNLQISPVTVVFDDVDIMKFNGVSYMIHVFICHKDEEIKVPHKTQDYFDHKNHAGFTTIFGKGLGCSGCEMRKPFKLSVNVQDTLIKLGLSRYDIKLIIKCVSSSKLHEEVLEVKDLPLKEPRIVFDLFEDKDRSMQNGDTSGDIGQLQTWMKRYGYYSGDIDNKFGTVTEESVNKVKEMTGYKDSTGIADQEFLDHILRKRCDNKDVGEESAAWIRPQQIQSTNLKLKDYMKDKVISYYIEEKNMPTIKGHVDKDIKAALDMWAKELNFTTERVMDRSRADLSFLWKLRDDTEYSSDGQGGILALGSKDDNCVYFDAAERWTTRETNNDDINSPIIYNVALHEIGHSMGLLHSNNTTDVMAPYYDVRNVVLSKDEKHRLHKLYV